MTRDILDQIDHVLEDDDVSIDAMRWTPDLAPEPAPLPPVSVCLRQFARVAIAVDLEPFASAMRHMARELGKVMRRHERTFHLVAVARLAPRERRRHRIRCDLCNPAGNPPPMPRAQHGYRRRLNARRGGSRR